MSAPLADRIAAYDWDAIAARLDLFIGHLRIGGNKTACEFVSFGAVRVGHRRTWKKKIQF